MTRLRLDQIVVARGLAPSRERARALILAGLVKVNGDPVSKAGAQIDSGAAVEVTKPEHPYVGRGGVKLAHALDTFHVNVAGRIGGAVNRPAAEIYPELRAGLNPGVIVVPAHTMLIGICQERGCTYEAL